MVVDPRVDFIGVVEHPLTISMVKLVDIISWGCKNNLVIIRWVEFAESNNNHIGVHILTQ